MGGRVKPTTKRTKALKAPVAKVPKTKRTKVLKTPAAKMPKTKRTKVLKTPDPPQDDSAEPDDDCDDIEECDKSTVKIAQPSQCTIIRIEPSELPGKYFDCEICHSSPIEYCVRGGRANAFQAIWMSAGPVPARGRSIRRC